MELLVIKSFESGENHTSLNYLYKLVNNTIPYTLPLRSYRRFGQSVFHYIFKEIFEKKKIKEDLSLGELFTKAKLHNAEHYRTNIVNWRIDHFRSILHSCRYRPLGLYRQQLCKSQFTGSL